MSRTMVRRVFGWPAALATLAVLSVCTLFVYAADAFGYWGMPFDMADMVDMKIIYVSLPVLVCFGLNFLTVDAFTKQRAALRTLPIGSTRIGSILWVQMVALAPVWILVTCSPLLVYNRGATPPAILEISFLGLACGTGMTALWVAGAHVGTSPCKRTISMAIAMIATGPALIVLVVLAVLGKVPSYWLTPLVVALVGYTWVQREALAHMNPKMNSRITPSRKTASPGGFGSRRALPAGMGHFVFMSLFGACALGWMMWMLHSEHGLELFAMWIMPGMFLGQCVVRECRFFKTMRLVPVTSGQLLARTARRYYAATGLMTIMAVGVSWALRGTFSWTPVAAVAAGAGAALFVTVWNLKPALDVPFGRSSIVCLWAISMAALVVARAGLFPPEGYYPAAFWVSVYAALVLNPLGLLLLYRAIDRGSSVYVRVERGLSIMGQSVIGGRL